MTSPILLVHGAWHGGCCWQRVVPLLESAGHPVYAPTLAGLAPGDAGEPPALTSQIDQIVDLIETADLARVTLVGHSWAGMIITGAASRIGDRIASLVYLDAAVPADGDDFASQVPGQDAAGLARRRGMYQSMAPDGAWIAPPPAQAVGVTDPADAAWLTGLLRPHPLRTWLEPVPVNDAALGALQKTYVLATRPASDMMGYPAHARQFAGMSGWTVHEIATGHDMMVTEPVRTAELILGAVPS